MKTKENVKEMYSLSLTRRVWKKKTIIIISQLLAIHDFIRGCDVTFSTRFSRVDSLLLQVSNIREGSNLSGATIAIKWKEDTHIPPPRPQRPAGHLVPHRHCAPHEVKRGSSRFIAPEHSGVYIPTFKKTVVKVVLSVFPLVVFWV